MIYKHFEEVWDEAEGLFTELNPATISGVISGALEELFNNTDETVRTKEEIIGNILLEVCKLSKYYNVNVYDLLVKEIQNHKSILLDKSEIAV